VQSFPDPPSPQHTILIAEDQPLIRDLLTSFLREEGYAVVGAADGTEAIQLISKLAPPAGPLCLGVVDMMLPELDGPAVMDHLAQQGILVPIVAMSAVQANLLAAQARGARAALVNPFELGQLLGVISQHCLHAPSSAAPALFF